MVESLLPTLALNNVQEWPKLARRAAIRRTPDGKRMTELIDRLAGPDATWPNEESGGEAIRKNIAE
jgi:hypothetical protein